MGLLSNLRYGLAGAAEYGAKALQEEQEREGKLKDATNLAEIKSRLELQAEALKESLKTRREAEQRQVKQGAIDSRLDANVEGELSNRYAQPVAGDTPMTPEQQAAQEDGLKRLRVEREQEKLKLMRNPENMLRAAVDAGYESPDKLLAHMDKQELGAAKREAEAAKMEAKLLELQLKYGNKGGPGATGPGGEKAPSGYRFNDSGDLEAIKGGPADTKLQGAYNADTAALNGGIAGFDRLALSANKLLNHPGLNGILGVAGKFPNMPGGEAADAAALLENLKSQVGFSVLQDMRNNSKTGGALGSVSDDEGKRLEANLAALDTKQSPEQFRRSLEEILSYAEGAKGRLQSAYNLKHGPKEEAPKAGGSGGIPRISNPAELASVPSGTVFQAPDGSIRRKP